MRKKTNSRHRQKKRSPLLLTVVSIIGLGLIGCTTEAPLPTPKVTDPPAVTTEAPEEESPEPEATPAPAVIAECEDLASITDVHAIFGNYQIVADPQRMYDQFVYRLGPAATVAVQESSQSRFCSWGVPNSDGFTDVFIAELPDSTLEAFLAALEESIYVKSELNGATVFVWDEAARIGPGVAWYAFDGNVWIASISGDIEGGLGPQVLERMRATNPHLSGQ